MWLARYTIAACRRRGAISAEQPMRYRKKPLVVEAVQYEPGLEDGFFDGQPFIRTREGDMRVTLGDFVVTGIEGERYPVKESIFKASYEPVWE